MKWFKDHLRNKFLAGTLAAVPVIIVVWAAWQVEERMRPLEQGLGIPLPGAGVLLALVAVYLLGLLVTSFVGRLCLRLADRLLQTVPGLNLAYRAWKDILVVSPEKAGMFSEVVLVPQGGAGGQLGFTSGTPLPSDPTCICVLLPGIPNPLSGRLLVVRRELCVPLKMSMEEAFKFLLSTGNYLPPTLHGLSPARPTVVPVEGSTSGNTL